MAKSKQLCEKHAAKAAKAAERSGAGRTGTPEKKRRPFPETAPEKHSLDLHLYGCRLISALQDFVVKDARGKASIPADKPLGPLSGLAAWGAALVNLMSPEGVYMNLDLSAIKDPSAVEQLREMLSLGSDYSPPMPAQVVEEIWAGIDLHSFRPALKFKGEVENVPLPPRAMLLIDVLEMLCARWGVKVKAQRPQETTTPATEGIENTEKKGTSPRGPSRGDQGPGTKDQKKGGPVEDRGSRIEDRGSTAMPWPPPREQDNDKGKKKAPIGSQPLYADQTPQQKAANTLRNRIIQGRRADALAAIGQTPLAELEACEFLGLTGDWRGAAVAKRIEDLRIAQDMADFGEPQGRAAERAAVGEKAEDQA